MEKFFKILFVGTILMVNKAAAWLLLTFIAVSLIENGEADGKLYNSSILVIVIGVMLALLSLALSRHYARIQPAKTKAYVPHIDQEPGDRKELYPSLSKEEEA